MKSARDKLIEEVVLAGRPSARSKLFELFVAGMPVLVIAGSALFVFVVSILGGCIGNT